MEYCYYTFWGLLMFCIILCELSDKSHVYSEINALKNFNTKTGESRLISEQENHELSEANNSESIPEFKLHTNQGNIQSKTDVMKNSHISENRKENNPTYYKELLYLGTNLFWDEELESRYITYKIENLVSWQDAVTLVNIGIDTPRYSKICDIEEPEALDVWVDKYRKLPVDYLPDDLKNVNKKYCSRSLKLRSEACEAFETMCEAAIEDGISLIAVSAFRDYDYQEKVYYKYYTKKMSLNEYNATRDRVSARAGHSEHQTGYAVDVGCDEDSLLEESFENTEAGIWIAHNCVNYGFILRYPKGKEHITGYKYEPWHLRYLGVDLARKVYDSGLTYDEFCARNLRILYEEYISLYMLSDD